MLGSASDIKYDVFISYARVDGREHAERLDADLQRVGYSTWHDTRSIDPYQDFSAEIEMAIYSSRYVIVCITPSIEANPDSFVRREIIYAENKHKPIIPLIFPCADPPILVNHLTWIPFFAELDPGTLDYVGGLDALLDRLRAQPGPSPRRKTDDPYAEYLQDLHDSIVYFLNQTVFSLITLSGESDPGAVDTSRRKVLPVEFYARAGIASPGERAISFDNFHAAYDHFGGRVLLLGEPGAGKTTTLMAFAREMVAVRQSDPAQPLPVLSTIATWDSQKQTPLVKWLADRVPVLERKDLARLVANGRALLLFDGLDELSASREEPDPSTPGGKRTYDPRLRFMNAFARAIPAGTPTVVTCRVKDYATIGEKIALGGAVTLHPLDDNQMREYLSEMPYLWDALIADDDLREIARTPLLLSLFAFAYRDQGEKARELTNLTDSPGALREAIFTQYIDHRYAHEERRAKSLDTDAKLLFSLEDVYRMLGWVAMQNAAGGPNVIDNVLKTRSFQVGGYVQQRRGIEMIGLATKLHILSPSGDDTLHFTHLLLRDVLAFRYAYSCRETDEYWIRARAMEALGGSRDSRALELLTHALQRDAVASVRGNAASALARLGDMRAVEPLVQALLDDKTDLVRFKAAYALASLGDPGVFEPLIHSLQHDLPIRESVASALGQLGDPRAIEPLIQILLHDLASGVRCSAAKALGDLGTPVAVNPLTKALEDIERCGSWFRVCDHAALALVKIGTSEALAAFEAWRPVLVRTLLHDTDADARRSAAYSFGALIGRDRVVDSLIQALEDVTESTWGYRVCDLAARALEEIGTQESRRAVEAWRSLQ